jgi:hypothetical protein
VSAILRSIQLRRQLVDLRAALADEDVEHVLDAARSSLIACATVCISLTDGADRLSRACSTCSSTGSSS